MERSAEVTEKQIEEERQYAYRAYENSAELEREAVVILDEKRRQLLLRKDESIIEWLKRQGEANGT
jgi:hypothetical protein